MFDFLRRWRDRSSQLRKKRTPKVSKRQSRPRLEMLEDRIAPAVFNVNSLADVLNPSAGIVTLRSAIESANATPGGNAKGGRGACNLTSRNAERRRPYVPL